MSRRDPPRRPSEDPDDPDEVEDTEPSGPPRRRGGRHPRPSVKPWQPEEGDAAGEDEAPSDRPPGLLHRPKRPIFYRARDSLYFEPLVALAIIVLLLVGLWAYTQNWPPVYVVESSSMQHGTVDQVGLINTGDLVLAQKLSVSQITTYVEGITTHYATYGEYGDVVLYQPNGLAGTPIIHRAIIYLIAASDGSYSAPSLNGLACGSAANAVYTASSSPNGCGTSELRGLLTLHHIGWQSVDVPIDLTALGGASGYITMGDNNYDPSTNPAQGITDQSRDLSALVQPGWVLGAARGMIPWFGSLKLLLEGRAAEVPTQSWEFLGLSLVGLVLVAMGIHFLLRAEGVQDPRRKGREEEDEDDDGEGEGPPRPPHRWSRALRGWRAHSDEEEDEETAESRPNVEPPPPPRRGRPRPSVGRHGGRHPPKNRDRGDGDDHL
jgi:signal peptidase